MKIRYTGAADEKILTDEDMAKLGVEDHPGLWWTANMPVLDVEDDIAEVLLQLRDFAVEPDEAEELVEDHTRDELLEQAKALKITGVSKMSKDELAQAIADRQNDDSINEPEALEPSA